MWYQEKEVLIRHIKNIFQTIFGKRKASVPEAEKRILPEKEGQDDTDVLESRAPGVDHNLIPKDQAETPKSRKKKKRQPWDITRFQVPEATGKVRFHDLNLPVKIMHGIFDLGFEYCTPIQAEILPKALDGVDVTGRAQTGTGKSAAFLIAMYTLFPRKPLKGKRRPGRPRALILAPTRELAIQITRDAQAIGKYTRSRIITIFGGMAYKKQKKTLEEKVFDIIAATPGRLLDFTQQGLIDLGKIEVLVIDEADRMLDMGFIPDIRNAKFHKVDPYYELNFCA